ncbi:MAG: hypothetical protein E7D27_03195 [Clostridium celatum]|nr:hypothetical protein [Clostridium celatum]
MTKAEKDFYNTLNEVAKSIHKESSELSYEELKSVLNSVKEKLVVRE